MPDELLWVVNPDSEERLRVIPGALRKGWVQVGKHIPRELKLVLCILSYQLHKSN